ncbi:hypothetical protein CF68_06905 [Cupriavidus sp. SK-4]|nr:hypothetical protein CF68_06905 [Cupriavidus sp. SK-4]
MYDPDDPLPSFGFDLDHCITPDANGVPRLSADAKQALAELGCYAEISPSGDGIHILGPGTLPGPHFTNNKIGREGYDSTKRGRYLTFTGKTLPGYESWKAPDPAALARWYGKWATRGSGRASGASTNARSAAQGTSPTGASATTAASSANPTGARTTGTQAGAPATPRGGWQFISVALHGRGLPQQIIDLIQRLDGLDTTYKNDGSHALYGACIELARAGFTDQEIVSILTDPAHDIATIAPRHTATADRQDNARWIAQYQITKARIAAMTGASVMARDHYTLALAYTNHLRVQAGHPAVYTQGAIWTVKDNIWVASKMDSVATDVGRYFRGHKSITTRTAYKSIAETAATLMEDDQFFESAPSGVACRDRFWRVEPGKIISEPLTPAHRQRLRQLADPVFSKPPAKFLKILTDAMGTDARGAEQIRLLQQCLGLALTGALWKHRVALCLVGPTTCGKSKVMEIFEKFFPDDAVGACPPSRWDREYHAAALAGKTLNVVGEVEPNMPIQGGAFKSIVGGDRIDGRHPSGRVFTFVSMAAQFFCGNRLPPTTDRSSAFFKRWRIIVFENTCPPSAVQTDLAEKIVATEMAELLGWLLEGARDLPQTGELPTSAAHDERIRQWRYANNSAAAFAVDPAYCQTDPTASVAGKDLYTLYRYTYAHNEGIQACTQQKFYEYLEDVAPDLGIVCTNRGGSKWYSGIKLNSQQAHSAGLPFAPVAGTGEESANAPELSAGGAAKA